MKQKRNNKKALVLGAGGFIGAHLVEKLKKQGFWIRGVDIKYPEFDKTCSDEFIIADLRKLSLCKKVIDGSYDEIYQLAADMGGAGYLFTGKHDADVLHNSAQINLNVLKMCKSNKATKIFFSSSACIYSIANQSNPNNPRCSEDSAYPAEPDSEYGWEKIFSERLYLSYKRNCGLNVKIARFHNVFGPKGAWHGGKEKAPAAICRKVAQAKNNGIIEIWGDGKQTRSFLYIDECLKGVRKLMDFYDFAGPVNIGSEEMVSINKLARMIIKISGKKLKIKNIKGPQGVRGRTSDNKLIKRELKWAPSMKLEQGLKKTYKWIEKQIKKKGQEK